MSFLFEYSSVSSNITGHIGTALHRASLRPCKRGPLSRIGFSNPPVSRFQSLISEVSKIPVSLYRIFKSQSCIDRFIAISWVIIAYHFFKNDVIAYRFLPLTGPYYTNLYFYSSHMSADSCTSKHDN